MEMHRVLRLSPALAAVLLATVPATAQQTRSIQPGMTTAEVESAFGEPAALSYRGAFTYYFYENGCERECGFLDLVIFENGQVVDAVLRAPWHDYAGDSSSPKGTIPEPTPGGMRLEIPQRVEPVGQPMEAVHRPEEEVAQEVRQPVERIEVRSSESALLQLLILPAWAEVTIDGRSHGQMARGELSLAAGTHVLVFERDNFVTVDTTIVLQPGERRQLRIQMTARQP